MFAAMVCSTTPIDSVSWSRKVWWISLNAENEASSITAFTWPSNSTGRMMIAGRRARAERRADADVVARRLR